MSHESPTRESAAVPALVSPPPRRRASELLLDFLEHEHGRTITLGGLVALLGDRAFGMMLLLLAIPNVIPMPGLSTAVGIPMILLGAQMAAGMRQPWLPRRLASVGFDRDAFLGVVRRVHPHVARVERHLRPRLPQFTEALAERLLGLVIIVLAGVLSLPIVFGNLPPAVGIGLIALGLIERDGAFVLAGLVGSVLALAFVSAVVFGLGGAAWLLVRGLFA
ncbi:exopolysaccharide biosynthesis protein [Azospirillum oleiclasticum]|uniref:exopolysaccharide biosynthesis protein n=1 Tax=Azospirillum oleiclasticum TaxID=2735135 RepID=UPI0031B64345